MGIEILEFIYDYEFGKWQQFKVVVFFFIEQNEVLLFIIVDGNIMLFFWNGKLFISCCIIDGWSFVDFLKSEVNVFLWLGRVVFLLDGNVFIFVVFKEVLENLYCFLDIDIFVVLR